MKTKLPTIILCLGGGFALCGFLLIRSALSALLGQVQPQHFRYCGTGASVPLVLMVAVLENPQVLAGMLMLGGFVFIMAAILILRSRAKARFVLEALIWLALASSLGVTVAWAVVWVTGAPWTNRADIANLLGFGILMTVSVVFVFALGFLRGSSIRKAFAQDEHAA